MKPIFFTCCIAAVVGGLIFFFATDNGTPKSETTETVSTDKASAKVKPAAVQTRPDSSTARRKTSDKKEEACACCREKLERVKGKRLALEKWARETIATYGYEEGMKRVAAKSPALAKRLQQLLDQENGQSTSADSPQNQGGNRTAENQGKKSFLSR